MLSIWVFGTKNLKCISYSVVKVCRSSFVTSRYTAWWPLRHAVLQDNYWLQIITKRSIVADEIRRMGRWSLLVLVWRKSIHFRRRYARKAIFYMFVPSARKFAPLVTLVQRYVCSKLSVSAALLFQKMGGTGRMDKQTGPLHCKWNRQTIVDNTIRCALREDVRSLQFPYRTLFDYGRRGNFV